MATPLNAIKEELDAVARKAADAQKAFRALGGAAAGLKLGDVAKAIKEIEEKEKQLAAERRKQIQAVFDAANRAAAGIRAPLNVFQAALSAVQTNILGFVAKANPAAVQRFTLALDDFLATVGLAVVPVLNQMTIVLRTMGSALFGLSDHGKQLIATLAATVVGMVAFGAAALAVQTIMTGGLLPVFSALGGAVAGFAFASGAVGPVMKELGLAFAEVGDALGEVFAEVARIIADTAAPYLNLFVGLLREFTRILGPLMVTLAALNPLLNIPIALAAGLAKAVETVAPYILAIGQLIVDMVRFTYEQVRHVLSLFGVAIPGFGGDARRDKLPDNTGVAVRGTRTEDVSAVLQRAREAAFGAGLGAKDDPAKRTANGMDQLNQKAEEIRQEILKFIRTFPQTMGEKFMEAVGRLVQEITGIGAGSNPAQFGRDVVRTLGEDVQRDVGGVINGLASGLNQAGREFDAGVGAVRSFIFGS